MQNEEKLPVYLETSTLTNVPWYQRFGFEIYGKSELGIAAYNTVVDPSTDINKIDWKN